MQRSIAGVHRWVIVFSGVKSLTQVFQPETFENPGYGTHGSTRGRKGSCPTLLCGMTGDRAEPCRLRGNGRKNAWGEGIWPGVGISGEVTRTS